MSGILVVEDERDLQDVVAYNLRQAGFEVTTASDGITGLRLARETHPDLVILDLMLPGLAGTEVCRAIKADATLRGIRVVMVTAKGEEIDRVVGFELGADDYVVKPFSVRELVLRVQAILRRAPPEIAPVVSASAPSRTVDFGRLRIDRDAHRIWVDDKEIVLTALEFKLLCTLFDRRDRVQSRATLLDDVWGMSGDLLTRTVDTHVKRLREKLGTAGPYVETVRGAGYRFCAAPVETPA